MSSIWRRRPSPALVVACAALAVALGGTSYATVLQVPKNSVGTAQLRTNAVVSAKVRNGSLLRADFRAGQIPAGPAGAAGPAGPAGAAGAAGPPGPSDAYARAVSGPITLPVPFTTIANLPIPQAGRYVIWAKTGVRSTNTFGQLTCILVEVTGNLQVDQVRITRSVRRHAPQGSPSLSPSTAKITRGVGRRRRATYPGGVSALRRAGIVLRSVHRLLVEPQPLADLRDQAAHEMILRPRSRFANRNARP